MENGENHKRNWLLTAKTIIEQIRRQFFLSGSQKAKANWLVNFCSTCFRGCNCILMVAKGMHSECLKAVGFLSLLRGAQDQWKSLGFSESRREDPGAHVCDVEGRETEVQIFHAAFVFHYLEFRVTWLISGVCEGWEKGHHRGWLGG